MKRKTRITVWVAAAIVVVGGFVSWQTSRLGTVLSTMQVDGASELMIGTLAPQVLDPGVDGPTNEFPQPLLEQYKKDPSLTRSRYSLVITWLHASKLFNRGINSDLPVGTFVSSSSFLSVPKEDRVDGWRNPYCVFSQSHRVVFLSSGEGKTLSCDETLREVAKHAALSVTDSRLAKIDNVLVVVYQTEEGPPSAPSLAKRENSVHGRL